MIGRATNDTAKWNVTQRILAAWMRVPSLRLGQFIDNATHGRNPDMFTIEDASLADLCEEYAEEHGR